MLNMNGHFETIEEYLFGSRGKPGIVQLIHSYEGRLRMELALFSAVYDNIREFVYQLADHLQNIRLNVRQLILIGKYLRAGVMVKGQLQQTRKGVPQRAPLSPLLANILLDHFNKEFEKRGHKFVRYADDCYLGKNV